MNYEKEYKNFSEWWEQLTANNPEWKTLERLAAKDAWMEASKRAEANDAERSSNKCHIQNVMASYSIKQNLNIFDIANMSIKQSENGFSIWMLEPCEDGGLRKRCIVDASNVLEDARIELSNKECREFRSVYVADENCIEIQRR